MAPIVCNPTSGQSTSQPPLEIWTGIECTVNRVGDGYFDQLALSGHAERASDLRLIKDLGVRRVRYPILWERIAPHGLGRANWDWADDRLGQLRELGIEPIIGLVHHGSGPASTSLVEPGFAPGLAEFADAVAERYPWLRYFTPVNEPLTTARFSGLYGHWYPHGQSNASFVRALFNQCRAIQLAMAAIRERIPAAQLIQTEDLSKTYSTEPLAHQARFDNERRWLSLDLLCGRVDERHIFWRYLCEAGLEPGELEALQKAPCTPDILGFNYYPTSERFLDDELAHYPPHTHGGNDRERYADIEAVRVCAEGTAGPGALLREAWERYGLPLAITEAHIGAWREDQLRWLMEAWQTAQALREEGVPVRAVTAWALLGAYNWHTLVTRDEGYYEPGGFDVRGPAPRATLVGRAVQSLAEHGRYNHPVLAQPGWWHRPERLLYPARNRDSQVDTLNPASRASASPRPVLILGATDLLGLTFTRMCETRGLAYCAVAQSDLDIADPDAVARVLAEHQPWSVINAARYMRVDEAEQQPVRCHRFNVLGARTLAQACAQAELPLLTFSSDLVFDGAQSSPYVESSPTAPINVFGATQAEAEIQVLNLWPSALIVRTSTFFDPSDKTNFLARTFRQLAAGKVVRAPDDRLVSPTYVPDLVRASLELLLDGTSGVWHLANVGALSWVDFARLGAELANISTANLESGSVEEPQPSLAPRPAYRVLSSERGSLMPSLTDAVSRYCREAARQI
jgi:dTDP-4-dehydrorhamnose reductase